MNSNSTIVPQHDEEGALSKICKALDNPKWDFRTVRGIAEETGLLEAQIERELASHPTVIRKLPITDKSGRPIYTSTSHPIRWKERLAVLQSALGGKLSSS